jgi:mannose-1-phosphate guanylyltransferase/mannose-6-phosphate isomerase
MTTLVPVLLAGGTGTRLWPTSRKSHPKQFIDFTFSGDSLLQSALKRSQILPESAPWIIVTSEEYRFLVAQQAKETGSEVGSIILEPFARNTAPAIALAAFEALDKYESPKLFVQTADHYIKDLDQYACAARQAFKSEAPFFLFGIQPTYPEMGYGYIECRTAGNSLALVSSFKEKPDLAVAESFLKAGNYLWNSGMFMLDAENYLKELQRLEPTVFAACQGAHKNASIDLDFKRVDTASFSESPSVSVDHAVMERSPNLYVLPYRGDWSDLGSWNSIKSFADQDTDGNAIQGDGILIESQNTYVRAESRLVTGIGLNNLTIIETHDAVLIADANKTQQVKDLVSILNSRKRKESSEHRTVLRPWGTYEILAAGDRFQVKQILVDPGACLSLQMHHHRAEHWVIVSGTAEVQVNDSRHLLTEDQSIYIPVGSKHRLRNPGKLPLTLIEVQSGSYLGEDDIVRLEDNYGRS